MVNGKIIHKKKKIVAFFMILFSIIFLLIWYDTIHRTSGIEEVIKGCTMSLMVFLSILYLGNN